MQIEEKSRFVPNSFDDFIPDKSDFPLLYSKLADLFHESIMEFYKKVKSTEPIAICSVKSKSIYSYSIFDGF